MAGSAPVTLTLYQRSDSVVVSVSCKVTFAFPVDVTEKMFVNPVLVPVVALERVYEPIGFFSAASLKTCTSASLAPAGKLAI